MEAERWRAQLKLLAAGVALAVSISFGTHLFFERKHRAVLKQLLDTQLRLKRELEALRTQLQQLSTPTCQASCSSASTTTIPIPISPSIIRTEDKDIARTDAPRRLIRRHSKEREPYVRNDDEEFFEFSEC